MSSARLDVRQSAWEWERPRIIELENRANECDLSVPRYTRGADGRWVELNVELRRGLDSLRLSLAECLENHHGLTEEDECEALEMLRKCEALSRPQP